ncbi:glycosyl-4,4'-diaponeurosporenoate acyltransferase [Lentibacillus saliphilus]|uniref:glycosyl-4,4'-diaponeurosporenoate acyltransferase CrtO family protein n=1 Tax=Lentibacillus saliphilus TaxID=2737028 RepID=UPI001C30CB6E|nr:glycosyl-4,4'-diaponeurosporenoate acyltransferase [Lentibacillus saliphilus]
MPFVSLSTPWTIVVDILAWGFFHIIISVICLKLPRSYFDQQHTIYHIRSWEREGDFWQHVFKIKAWKDFIPDGTLILKQGFSKHQLPGRSIRDLILFLSESKRAELTHWLSILPAPLFFLWNPVWAGWVMIVYALLFNLPIIIVQRFNRARIERILDKWVQMEFKHKMAR